MKAIIVEDEIPARTRLKKLLSDVKVDIEVVQELDSVASVIKWLSENDEPDVVFLDIHLADGNAFEIFTTVKINCAIIFITAYDEYAIQAFRSNAVDYLLKPIKINELEEAIGKVQAREKSDVVPYDMLKEIIEANRRKEKRFLIKLGKKFHLASATDIAYIYTEHKQVFIIRKDGKRLPIDKSLEHLELDLDPRHFFRINRQMIVSVESIKELLPASKSRVRLVLDPAYENEAVVSTEKSPLFKSWLQKS